ncbi:hypothetical protein RIVM261_023070 [Rivularia sp. IAM M-261]|nr:hypothetical protein RIVM261_023070 [Rivularia sp. IAM M-261]
MTPHPKKSLAIACASGSFKGAFGFGALTALITLKDNRLELALGVHAANNLSFLFVTTKDSVLAVPAMWTAKDTGDPRLEVLMFLLQSLIFYYIFFGRRKKVMQAIPKKNESLEKLS